MTKDWDEELSSKKFNVENALIMSVRDSIIMPVSYLYKKERLAEYKEILDRCHIYMIGYIPKILSPDPGVIDGDHIITKWHIGGKLYEVRTNIFVEGCTVQAKDGRWWIIDPEGINRHPDKIIERARQQLGDEQTAFPFTVLYIGQAFGKNGSRQALHRLLQGHEKLQEISIKGPPEEHTLYLLLIDLRPGTDLSMLFNPKAENQNNTHSRIVNGLEAQAEITEGEKTILYEASLIRYFQPPYNKEFKQNFPSTNMALLQGCYGRDISAIVAEVNIDADFQIASETVPPKKHHIANYDLHSEEERKIFFALDSE